MKAAEIKEITDKELQEKIYDEQAKLQRLKINHAITPLDNPLIIKDSRRLIARLKTELHQRVLNENKS